MKKKQGRPPSDNSRNNQYRVRLTDDENEMLNHCSKILGLTKAEIIRQGIKNTYEKTLKK